jgi:hypothetical protein
VCGDFGYGMLFVYENDTSKALYIMQTSPHKRGIRNGPKALKPIPVIVRCK